MMKQLSFAGIELTEKPAKRTKEPKAEPAPRVAKRKKPLRKARQGTAAEVEVERKRLVGQALKIYERLQLGTATNVELAEISIKYTSRISDVRQAGHPVDVVSRDYKTGLTVYQLRQQCSESN